MKIKPQVRTYQLKNLNEEEKTIELSFASDEPYERWFGVEILRISEEAVNFERLKNSAPLLFNHNRDLVIGVVEKAWIDGNKLRAKVKFGNSQKAQEVFEDVKAGILRNVSVGYEIGEMKLVGERDGLDVYEVTKWTPLEISIVSIPADITVGIGREYKFKGGKMGKEKEINIQEVQEKAKSEERKRVAEITAIAEKFNKKELAKRAIEDGMSVEEFRAKILDELSQTPIDTKAEIGMSEKEIREYSLLRALRALANPFDKRAQEEAKFEFEVSAEAQRKLGIEAKGILVPFDVLSRSLTATGDDTGNNIIPDKLMTSQFVDLLRNKSALIDLATHLTGLTGNIQIPRQIGATTANTYGENETIAESDITLDQITLSPKRLGAASSYSKQLLAQTSMDVENLIRNDLLAQIALKLDSIIIDLVLNTTGVGLVEIGDNGGAPKWEHFVALESEVAIDNADVKGMRYVINAKTQGYCKTTPKIDGYPQFIIEQNQINGYGFRVSNQVPSNLTKGDGENLSAILFGNFRDILVGFWGGMDLIVDPYTKKKEGLVEIVADQFYDVAIRRPQSLAIIKDAEV